MEGLVQTAEVSDDVIWALDEIVDALEEDIVFGFLSPNERLVEDVLCNRFDVTRHTIRSALSRLEQAGLVVRKRNIGARVKAYSVEEVKEIYDVRHLLETKAAREIKFPVPQESLDELIMIQKKHDRAAVAKDMRTGFKMNIIFHEQLFGLANNRVLSELIKDLALRAHVIRFRSMVVPSSLERARQEHWSIIKALQNQDRDALIRVCNEHLVPSRERYLEQYNSLMRSHE